MNITKEEIQKFLKDSVEWLENQQEGCTTLKLDDRLAVCVGWLPGYGNEARDDVIQASDNPDWGINAGIKVWTSDDMRTDYEFINSPYYDNGDVVETDTSLDPSDKDDDFDGVADYLLKTYEGLYDLNIEEDGISLIYDGILEIEKKYSDVNKYLNNEFIKKYNKNELVKRDYYVNEYNNNNKYEILNKTKKTDYVTIPSIGELFLNEFDNYWLNNYSNNSLGLYYTIDENKMLFSDLSSNSHHIRPIIKVNIDMVVSGGNGMKNSPLILSGLGDKYVEED